MSCYHHVTLARYTGPCRDNGRYYIYILERIHKMLPAYMEVRFPSNHTVSASHQKQGKKSNKKQSDEKVDETLAVNCVAVGDG